MTTMTIKFTLQNETKGALRYAELLPNGTSAQYPNSPGAKIGTLYLRKSAFGSAQGPETFPKQITIRIDEGH